MVARRHRARVQQAPPHVPGRVDPIAPGGTQAHPPVRALAGGLAHATVHELLRLQLPGRRRTRRQAVRAADAVPTSAVAPAPSAESTPAPAASPALGAVPAVAAAVAAARAAADLPGLPVQGVEAVSKLHPRGRVHGLRGRRTHILRGGQVLLLDDSIRRRGTGVVREPVRRE